MSTAPGAKPPVSIDPEEAKRPIGSDGETRRRAASISDGVASPVGSWEAELTGRPQAEQYCPLSETSAEQEGHFMEPRQRIAARAFSVSASSASGPTGDPQAFFIQMSGATLPTFVIRSNSGPTAPVFSICRLIWKAIMWPTG